MRAISSTAHIDVIPQDSRWKGLRPTVIRAVEAALKQQKVKKAALAVALSNDAEIQLLNHQYRAKNKPTNVLSFPAGEEIQGVMQLGDIILAYETILAEAKAQKKLLKHHITHLTIHGVLHLLGYDHEEESAAREMEKIEINILKTMGIANPYEVE